MRILLILGLLFFSLNAKSLFSNAEQGASSVYIGSLKNLMIATQKTRGLTNAYLNGNTAAQLLVYQNRSDMKKAIGKMESTTLASDPVINSRAVSISKALLKLNAKAFKQDPKVTFNEYSQQIEEILMLAQTVSQRASHSKQCAQTASKIMMLSMLPLTEYVGQLRGFGSGVAAKGTVTEDQIEKVSLLTYEIKSYNATIKDELGALISNYNSKLPSSLNSELANIDTSVAKFVDLSQGKLLRSPSKVDSDLYFDEGTALIKNIMKVYDSLNKAILDNSKGWF